jgi:glycosyltransferase involved in cell wall biosynthesis
MPVLSVVIPAYNEAATIHLILDKVRDCALPEGWTKELIVVNDCSKDGTEEAIERYVSANPSLPLTYRKHEVNKGKGAALHSGIAMATGDYVIIQDADLEYDPNEYVALLQPVIDGHADVVYGSRFMGGNAHRILFFWHSIGNAFLTFLSNMFTNLNLTDMETCYKLFRRDLIQSLNLRENRFGFEPEVTAKFPRFVFMKSESATTAEPLKKAKKLAGRTECAPSTASLSTERLGQNNQLLAASY